MKIPPLEWEEDFDDAGNSVWECLAPFGDEDGMYGWYWRLRQRLVNNGIEWFEAHDADLMSEDVGPETWKTLEEAKASIEMDNVKIVRQCMKEKGGP